MPAWDGTQPRLSQCLPALLACPPWEDAASGRVLSTLLPFSSAFLAFKIIIILRIWLFCQHICLHHMCAVLVEARKGIRAPGTVCSWRLHRNYSL